MSDPFVLFLVMATIFFNESKIPSSILCAIPQGTFIPSLVLINWSTRFRGEFCVIVYDGQLRRTSSDGNSSHGLWPSELKLGKNPFWNLYLKYLSTNLSENFDMVSLIILNNLTPARLLLNATVFSYLQNSAIFRYIVSNDSHDFWQIKNPHAQIVKDVLLNIQAKFCLNPSSSFRGEDFQSWKRKIWEKLHFRTHNSNIRQQICLKISGYIVGTILLIPDVS